MTGSTVRVFSLFFILERGTRRAVDASAKWPHPLATERCHRPSRHPETVVGAPPTHYSFPSDSRSREGRRTKGSSRLLIFSYLFALHKTRPVFCRCLHSRHVRDYSQNVPTSVIGNLYCDRSLFVNVLSDTLDVHLHSWEKWKEGSHPLPVPKNKGQRRTSEKVDTDWPFLGVTSRLF